MRAPDSEYDWLRWHEHERKRRPRRASTRWLLLGGLVALVAFPVVEMLRPDDRGASFVFPFLAVTIPATMSPFARQPFLTDRGFAMYDEFEQDALLGALRRSYLVSFCFVAAMLIWLALAQHLGWPFPTRLRQWEAVGGTVLVVIASLPVLIAEWTVPFPDPEDQPL